MGWSTSKCSLPPTPPPPLQHHSVDEMDITLGHLRCAEEVCLLAARAYRDHCTKVAWTTAFVSLDKVGCVHVDALATRSVAVESTEEVTAGHRRMRRASNIFVQDFWAPRGHDAAMDSLSAAQA